MAGGDLTGALSVCESFAKVLLGPSKGYFFGNVTVKVLPMGSHVNVSPGDRKSTRLNSSHGYISYAVFCLKKKFVLHSNVLIVSGMLVGASGTLLTMLMGRAMNRSVANVLFGAFGKVVAGPAAAAAGADGGSVRSTTADDVAVMLTYAKRVVVVPGYGLAVAQAQHEVRQLADLLEGKGVDVKYAIHPVAGRMPGHMNVLLAEANVPYDQLKEMDEINPDFPQTDVALVIGANDGCRDEVVAVRGVAAAARHVSPSRGPRGRV